MIITYKNNIKIKYGKIQKYSQHYSFIPIKIKKENIICPIQTPYMYIPFNIKEIEGKRNILDISFMNISNDTELSSFFDFLKYIEDNIYDKYKDKYKINRFLRNTEFNYAMRTKLDNCIFFNKYKQKIETFKTPTYGRFIIDLNGLWIYNNELWFQWFMIQGETNESFISHDYLFTDHTTNITPKKIQPVSLPPPPPPLPVFKKSSNKIIIKKSNKKVINNNNNVFAPPTLEELQITLSKLKKI